MMSWLTGKRWGGVMLWLVVGIFLPRIWQPSNFFIQDEQPWLDRSQTYSNALWKGDLAAAAEYPLSNHPAITLMTVVGPVVNLYGSSHQLKGTYAQWSLDDKREAAVWARYAWGLACSVALVLLYVTLSQLAYFSGRRYQAAIIVILFGLEPWIWGISRSVSVDVLMAIGVVGSFVAAAVAYERRYWAWVALSGAWWAVAFISKSPALITAPIILWLAVWTAKWQWRVMVRRALVWLASVWAMMSVCWPSFFVHPIARLRDVLARDQLHATMQEVYLWPGVHPPFFIFVLSTMALAGCLVYIAIRAREFWLGHRSWQVMDVLLLAGVWHGAVLVYLNGDQARKDLPAVALLAIVGAFGWVYGLNYIKRMSVGAGLALIGLQLCLVGAYFPHVISAYNYVFVADAGGKRLLVDVGNSSRLVADYINAHDKTAVYATAMDSLIQPYLDADKRGALRGFPSSGRLADLPPEVNVLVVPMSFAARIQFEPATKVLLQQLAGRTPREVLSIRDVPMFAIYYLK